jgi:hypothetical protein
VPGVGDLATALPGAVMIVEARRMGARKRAQSRMVVNTGVDLVIGAIPVLGDAFDLAFKSHKRNIAILKDELARIEAREGTRSSPEATRQANQEMEATWHSDTDQPTDRKTASVFPGNRVPLGRREGLAARSSATSPAKTRKSVPESGPRAKRA